MWTVLIRVPLVLNAHDHLDSDLAVDGLTLLDAVHGHWRWHYPGTPYMGILPMLTSLPAGPGLGGQSDHAGERWHVIWLLVVVSTFWLACQGVWARGRRLGDPAAGVLVAGDDLAVGTNHGGTPADARLAHRGVRWAFIVCLTRGGWPRAAALGALVRPGSLSRRDVPVHARGHGAGRVSRLALDRTCREPGSAWRPCFWSRCWSVSLPREIGRRVDPYDAYPSQFEATLERHGDLGTRPAAVPCIACPG